MRRAGQPPEGRTRARARPPPVPRRAPGRAPGGVKAASRPEVVPAGRRATPPQGGGTHHAGVGKPDPCAGLLRVKLFIDFAHFGPGRGKVRVVVLRREASGSGDAQPEGQDRPPATARTVLRP